ncbi:P-loop containing nucleoside triphosphate hydrolase protein [Gymnopilus junonius]|uniref:P-loop containing nucleoside triphosphate hydrolase protein n=1 Tax=Gymnopilus junonius TaxID=109634 RepID=A0A9P5TJV0_GYMJU|nr:P-loop containing nucleoside triphosphate hydrolase protein [Gymnopilus junonius]
MAWFDLNVGGGAGAGDDQQEGESVGAGGLMAKFSRETDDVRMASSLAAGQVLQYLTTTLASLSLAFSRSWSLTLIILSSVPLLILIQSLSQSLAAPLLHHERTETARAATLIERAISSIPTLKAFNAQHLELARAHTSFLTLQNHARRLNTVWGATSGMSQFVMMAMFVQAFWYGSKLVREGRNEPGDVMAVFWACLIATSNLQMCVPVGITVVKGKLAMVGLMELVGGEDGEDNDISALSAFERTSKRLSQRFSSLSSSSSSSSSSPVHPTHPSTRSRTLRKITPAKCHGELALHNLTFAYPTRPHLPVLKDVSLFIPAGEMTFIVGESGSGKSTVGQVLLGMYGVGSSSGASSEASGGQTQVQVQVQTQAQTQVQAQTQAEGTDATQDPLPIQNTGTLLLDEQDTRYLSTAFLRSHIVGVGQQGASGVVVLEGRSVWENVLVGLRESDWLLGDVPFAGGGAGGGGSKKEKRKKKEEEEDEHSPTTYDTAPLELRARVEAAARIALFHEFVRDLPYGWDTILGGTGSQSHSGHEGNANANANEENTTHGVGVGLSGGQKQRLALARAVLRDPSVLILDEPTSALDPTTRLLVFSALKRTRQEKNQTTVVITHDLSQIERGDFVYVMRGGRVVEGGYRGDLEKEPEGPIREEGEGGGGGGYFRKMLEAQMGMEGGGGAAPGVIEEPGTPILFGLSDRPCVGARGGCVESDDDDMDEEEEEEEEEGQELEIPGQAQQSQNQNQNQNQNLAAIRPLTWGNWMFEVVADLTGASALRRSRFGSGSEEGEGTVTEDEAEKGLGLSRGLSLSKTWSHQGRAGYKNRRPSSISIVIPQAKARMVLAEEGDEDEDEDEKAQDQCGTPRTPSKARKMRSLQFTPSSAATSFTAVNSLPYRSSYAKDDFYSKDQKRKSMGMEYVLEEKEFEDEKRAQHKNKEQQQQKNTQSQGGEEEAPPAFWSLIRTVLPTIPNKPLLILGLLISALSGAMTPIFSFLLSKLMYQVSIGASASQIPTINLLGGVVLGIAALDGVLLGTKYFLMETIGMGWVTALRSQSLRGVLRQDMTWFDDPRNGASGARLAQVIVRDGDDARNLVGVVFAQFLVVAAMLGVGLVWALVWGWQLTLAGFAIAPVFGGVMALQTRLVAGCEVRNKRAREEVARGYYEAIINVRAIRSMSFDPIFRKQFFSATDRALYTGVRGAFVEGCTYGVSSGLIYLAEALLFYIGAVLVGRGTYTYLQMVEVLNLVVFSVSIGSQLMAFTTRIAKAVQATADFNTLLHLPNSTSESTGTLKPPLTTGPITFTNVSFTYPSRPTQPVLKNLNLTINPGECVALVGSSGSGKSTVAALLQRLYEPTEGVVSVGVDMGGRGRGSGGATPIPLSAVDVRWLRKHLGVVSQQMSLLDASVADNVRYGGVAALSSSSSTSMITTSLPPSNDENIIISDVAIRAAAKKARVHEFVMGLPQGYDTPLGENAALISGGQAQRLMIARALAREESQSHAGGGGRILILDECTSALDVENQAAILESIRSMHRHEFGVEGEKGVDRKLETTTVMVTHKLPVMQMCDRIVVLHEGEIAEEGTYKELMERKGVFANLASGGEWVGE